ncbi:hypothetical protein C0989_000173 [Termitomyces sp. Mn162]|nr:hypothetical protein C0989_000173 [Termitomyces sp. Mn162]
MPWLAKTAVNNGFGAVESTAQTFLVGSHCAREYRKAENRFDQRTIRPETKDMSTLTPERNLPTRKEAQKDCDFDIPMPYSTSSEDEDKRG